MYEIKDGELLLAIVYNEKEKISYSWLFPVSEDCPLQWGICKAKAGTEMLPHIHRVRKRIPEHKTIEVIYVISGSLEATFYTLEKKIAGKIELVNGDICCLYDGGHGLKVLTNDTKFLEVKNGPFISVEEDKIRF